MGETDANGLPIEPSDGRLEELVEPIDPAEQTYLRLLGMDHFPESPEDQVFPIGFELSAALTEGFGPAMNQTLRDMHERSQRTYLSIDNGSLVPKPVLKGSRNDTTSIKVLMEIKRFQPDKYPLIIDFHTHPDGDPFFSAPDIEGLYDIELSPFISILGYAGTPARLLVLCRTRKVDNRARSISTEKINTLVAQDRVGVCIEDFAIYSVDVSPSYIPDPIKRTSTGGILFSRVQPSDAQAYVNL